MTTYRFMPSSRNTGFSLIEVLVAVLVLSTGMLALAALQASLTRNSVDAKVRSQGLAIAVDVLDRVRARASSSNGDYQSLPVAQGAWQTWSAPATFGTLQSPASYETRSTVTRFVRDATAAGCGGAANAPCFRPAVAADPYQLSGTAEFKRVNVEVRWTDAAGTAKTVSVNDVVTSVTRDKSTTVMTTQPTPASGVGAPVARVPRSFDRSIIPLAVGSGTETAASNPKPIAGYERGRTDETSYQVFTYSTEETGVAKLTRMIDTTVVGCRCERGDLPTSVPNSASYADIIMNPFFRVAKQPTYWDGKEYTAPEDGMSTMRGVPVESANQDQNLCVTCCLDHHDLANQPVKFDVVRSGGGTPAEPSHLHYGDTNDDGVLNATASTRAGEEYFEVCRMIRVDGVFRVATDARLKFMNLLETDPTVTTQSVPATRPRERYQEMVKDLIGQFVLSGATTPNVSGYDDILVDPNEILLGRRLDKRFLHNRALYLDYLEPEARDAVTSAISECPSGTPSIDCVLPVVPVVPINMTGLSQWSSSNQGNVRVYNLPRNIDFDDDAPEPRGLTEALVASVTETATAKLQQSNSGLTDSFGIDPADVSEVSVDTQSVRVGTSGGGGGGNGKIQVTAITGYARGSLPAAFGTLDSTGLTYVNCTDTGGLPVNCDSPVLLPNAIKLKVGSYNLQGSEKNVTVCGARQKVRHCQDYNVSGVTVAGVSLPGASIRFAGTLNSEVTTIDLGTVSNLTAVALTFTANPETVAPHSCPASGGGTSPIFVNPANPCQGTTP